MLRRGFTLLEILAVIIIIGILAALALPNFGKAKENALGKEAIANLKLIAAAERIYRLQFGSYYPFNGSIIAINSINSDLWLSLTEANWDYWIDGGIDTFTAYTDRKGSGTYSDCQYSIDESQDVPVVSAGTCP